MNVLWFFIRNSHLTLALKPLSNTKLLHTRKCYKNKVFRLLDKSILRNICHCQSPAFSADCDWDSHVQQFLLTLSALTKPFFWQSNPFWQSIPFQRDSQWLGPCPVSTLELGKYYTAMDDPGQGSSAPYNPNKELLYSPWVPAYYSCVSPTAVLSTNMVHFLLSLPTISSKQNIMAF